MTTAMPWYRRLCRRWIWRRRHLSATGRTWFCMDLLVLERPIWRSQQACRHAAGATGQSSTPLPTWYWHCLPQNGRDTAPAPERAGNAWFIDSGWVGLCSCRPGRRPAVIPCHSRQLWVKKSHIDNKHRIFQMGKRIHGWPDDRSNDRPSCPPWTFVPVWREQLPNGACPHGQSF